MTTTPITRMWSVRIFGRWYVYWKRTRDVTL